MINRFTQGLFVLLMGISVFLVGCEQKTETTKIIYISAIPDQKQSELNEAMTELSAILTEESGVKVEYKEVTDYSAVVNGFTRNEIQLAWFGGLTGVQAREKTPDSEAIVQRVQDEKFRSVFIANTHSGIEKLADYKGKSFTFGSESSTSGHLMPRYFLNEAGIVPETNFKGEVGYSGSHDKTIELVQNGTYDGGALNISVWERYVKENKVDLNKVKEIQLSSPYYDYHFAIQSKQKIDKEYGEGSYDKIKMALLHIDVKNNPKLMRFFNTEAFIETKNSNYAQIKATAEKLGLLK